MDSRVGVDPISDPDTAIMEMLLAALGRPNLHCAPCRSILEEVDGEGHDEFDHPGDTHATDVP
ncbi:MAG: hypothetical protein QOG75_6463 [Mycobacterium sp.]|jgi:hypothetical protein|nr:hypothetical protein [Mycobacterium sp.]